MKANKKTDIKDLVVPERVSAVENFFEMANAYPHLCTSCGMCVGVCPTDAIEMETNSYAQYVPKFIQENCIYCKKCIICCPGIDVSGSGKDLGDYKQLFLGFATDKDQRERSSSGGVISALSAWMLEKGIVDKAIMLSTEQSPVVPKIVVNTSPEEISSCSGSKYVIAPICVAMKNFDRKSLITVLPCQSIAMKRMRKNQGYVFGLFCSGAQTKDIVEYVSQKEAIRVDDIRHINFRGGSWPGKLSIQTNHEEIAIPYNRSYYTAAANGGYFTIQGCALCPDYFNEDADISFGDPWGVKHAPDLLLGKTLLIVRTEKGSELLKEAQADGVISLEMVSEDQVIKGHQKSIYFKKKTLYVRMKKLMELGLPLPKHKENLSKRYNLFDSLIHAYYLKNNFSMKKHYHKIFNYSKRRIFLERYLVHTVHTIYLKLLRLILNNSSRN